MKRRNNQPEVQRRKEAKVDNGQVEEGEDVAEFIVGTYQEFVVGYKLLRRRSSQDGNESFSLKQSFTNHAHAKSVRSIVPIGKYVASGSADEIIKLVNLETRQEHGTLQPQNGTVTCLTSFGSQYLFSGSTDGSICIWKSGSWRCEKTFKKAHERGVNGITIHPSGKLAMSVGEDRTLKTWNLIKGRSGFVTNLKAVADCIQFSPEGNLYAVGVSNRVDVYANVSAKVIYSIPFGKRVSCLCFRDEQTLFVAGDQESVEVHDVAQSKKLTSFSAHKNRVKDMKFVNQLNILVTASNDGFIKVWGFPKDSAISSPPKLVTEIDTTCRIICLAVWTKDLITEDAPENSSNSEDEGSDAEMEVVEAEDEDDLEDD